MAESSATGARRVKVYVLNENDKWDDRGEGHVTCERDHRTAGFVLKVVAEGSGRVTMCSQVRPLQDAFYQMQEDTIISWQEDPLPNSNDVPTEIALSFAEADGCREIWEKICHIDSAFTQQQGQTGNKHIPPSNAPNSPQELQHQQNQPDASSHGIPNGTLSLPVSIAPHNSGGPNPLLSTGDSAMPPTSTTDNNLHRNHHNSLVDTTTDIAHSSRFFEESLESPSPWGTDPIDDVIFRDNTNVLFLGSPGALVPPSVASDAAVAAGFVMPDPDRAGIEDLYRIMSGQGAIHIPAARERIISEVSSGDYVSKLCQVFRECEKSTDIEGLAMLYHIVRCFFIVGTGSVLEVLVHDKNLMDIVGCLEYDQEHIAELERNQAEAKRLAAERSAKPTDCPRKESATVVASEASSDKSNDNSNDGSQPTKGLASDGLLTSERGGRSSVAEQSQAVSKGKDAVLVEKEIHPEHDASQNKDDVATAVKAKKEVSRSGDVETCMDRQDSSSPPAEGAVIVDSSAVSNEVKLESPAQKNLSEETTSSGNLVGDGSERRLVVRVHRDFLERKVSYKSVVPITDQNVVAKIHQNYRVAYIRDVILSRAFDENANSALSGVIVCNNVDIIMYFISGSSALQELFDRLKSAMEQRQKRNWNNWSHSSRTKYQKDAAARGGTSDGDHPRKRCSFSDEVCVTSSRGPEPIPLQCEKEGSSDTSDITPRSNAKTSCHSGVTGTTGDSNATAIGDPSTSKDGSSRAVESARALGDSVTGGPVSSQSEDDIQRELCSMLGLLRELCSVVKGQQPALKNRFHALLTELGVLEVAVSLLLDNDRTIRSLCCDILSAAVVHDQTEVRSHILKNVTLQEKADGKRIGVPLRSAPIGPKSEVGPGRVMQRVNEAGVHMDVASGTELECSKGENMATASVSPRSTTAAIQDSGHAKRQESAKAKQENSSLNETDCSKPKGRNVDNQPGASKTGFHANRDVGTYAPGRDVCMEVDENNAGSDSALQPMPAKGSAENLSLSSKLTSLSARDRSSPAKTDAEGWADSLVQRKVAATKSSENCQADEQFPLLAAMVDVVCQDRVGGVALTVLDLLRMLLDPTNMRTPSDKDLFLDVFYENFISRLLTPISKCRKNEQDRAEKGLPCGPDGNVTHVCDLLSFCVINHAYRGRYFVLGWDVGGRIAKLVDHRKAYVRLSALRFIRACVGMAEDMLDRYIVGEKLFDPIMTMLKKNGNKDNLISSAVLDMLSFIYHKGRHDLLKHLMEKYSNVLELTTTYCSLFIEAKKLFEELSSPTTGQRDGTENARVGGGTDGGARTQADVEMKPIDGRDISSSDKGKAKGGFEARGTGLRLVSGLLEQEIRMSHDQDNADRFFTRCSTEVQSMDDFHSLVVRSVCTDGQERDCEFTDRSSDGCAGKQQGVKSAEEATIEETSDHSKSGDMRRDTVAKSDGRMLSHGKKEKRKPSLVGYSVADSDEEEDEGVDHRDGRSVRVIGGCASGGSAGSSGLRLSLSRSEVRSGDVRLEDDTGVGICDTSEDSASPRKRERSGKVRGSRTGRGRMADGGIETCTQAVMERQGSEFDELDSKLEEGEEGSPPKRRRTTEWGRDAKGVGGSEVKAMSTEEAEVGAKGKRKRCEGQGGDDCER